MWKMHCEPKKMKQSKKKIKGRVVYTVKRTIEI